MSALTALMFIVGGRPTMQKCWKSLGVVGAPVVVVLVVVLVVVGVVVSLLLKEGEGEAAAC